ncbi:MAG: C_GCAxxG_C_C family protein [Desulfobulbaceae bacterium]|nr:MAG: C_GCAxxG_C_C family protein [Desulfobulbaceae bacterium]
MFEDISAESAATLAQGYFNGGYHCAEAVVAACLESIGDGSVEAIAHATAFGGGFGRTFFETCGVISGCLIVIGHFYGRRQPGGSWDVPATLGAKVMELFSEKHETRNCQVLRDRFGEEAQMAECGKLVYQGVYDLITFLQSEECAQLVRAYD